jgi:hypothetical protein
MKYSGYKQSNACNVKRKAIKEYKGKVPFSITQVSSDSVLQCLYNTTREKEIYLISQALNLSTTNARKQQQTTTNNKKASENE